MHCTSNLRCVPVPSQREIKQIPDLASARVCKDATVFCFVLFCVCVFVCVCVTFEVACSIVYKAIPLSDSSDSFFKRLLGSVVF